MMGKITGPIKNMVVAGPRENGVLKTRHDTTREIVVEEKKTMEAVGMRTQEINGNGAKCHLRKFER